MGAAEAMEQGGAGVSTGAIYSNGVQVSSNGYNGICYMEI